LLSSNDPIGRAAIGGVGIFETCHFLPKVITYEIYRLTRCGIAERQFRDGAAFGQPFRRGPPAPGERDGRRAAGSFGAGRLDIRLPRLNASVRPGKAFEGISGMDRQEMTFTARILRKEDFLPRYIVVPPEHVSGRTRSFPAGILLNGAGPFVRTVRPWGKGSDVFFFNLTAPQCTRAGLDTNDLCRVTIIPATE
jgi:hypothetical protein